MKYEWKKHDRELYGAKRTPTLISVPKQNYIMISGSGNPNDQDFSKKAAALYAFAYAIKMDYKAAAIMNNNEVHDFAVYPLEVVWSLKHGDRPDRRESEYTIMIRQPHFITENMTTSVLERIVKCVLILCRTENALRFYILVPMMMNPLLLRKWRNLQRIMD